MSSAPASWLLVMTRRIMAAGTFSPMNPLAPWFKLQTLAPVYVASIAATLAGFVALTQAMKRHDIRRIGWP